MISRGRLIAGGALAFALAAATTAHAEKYDHVVTSKDGTAIHVSVYKPDSATPENPVPVIQHSHGWGGSRATSPTAFAKEQAAGYAVVSIDQRGHGASGGEANVEDPEFEGQDMIAINDYIASLPWVAKNEGRPTDPVLFAMGGSYGGGYQFVGAFTELRDLGYTRYDALAPEITWFNLSESLAPSKVVRTAWVTVLYAAGVANVPQYIHEAFAIGATTGTWPDGTVPAGTNMEAEFFEHGPSGHVKAGRKLDIPVLIGQGLTDNLFNLNQGWKNFEQALTPAAREKSLFVGYNGGHALPNVVPLGTSGSGDFCSGQGGFGALRAKFFDAVRDGGDSGSLLPAKYNMSTQTGGCIRTDSLEPTKSYDIGVDVDVARGTITTTGAGAIQHHEIASGPLKLSGIPFVKSEVTTAGVDQRVFFAISVGTNQADATVVQNNMMPLRELTPVVQQDRTIELPGIAVDVPAGKKVFLTVSPVSDMSFGHGSIRTPGAVGLDDLKVQLPVVE